MQHTTKAVWVSQTEACKQCGISIVKLKALIEKHDLEVTDSTRDTRKKLVNIEEVRKALGPR